jgi:hypothetical protein
MALSASGSRAFSDRTDVIWEVRSGANELALRRKEWLRR